MKRLSRDNTRSENHDKTRLHRLTPGWRLGLGLVLAAFVIAVTGCEEAVGSAARNSIANFATTIVSAAIDNALGR